MSLYSTLVSTEQLDPDEARLVAKNVYDGVGGFCPPPGPLGSAETSCLKREAWWHWCVNLFTLLKNYSNISVV